MKRFIFITILVLAFTQPAFALKIEVDDLGGMRFQITLTEIANVMGRVYSLDRTTGELTFGDGLPGATPPTGQPGIGVYRNGGGTQGNISEFYTLPSDLKELLIPAGDFPNSNLEFILIGIRSVKFDVSPRGIDVISVGTVPGPATILLLSTGIAGLIVPRIWKKFKSRPAT